MKCRQCGKEVPDGAAFCPACGTRIMEMNAAAPNVQQGAPGPINPAPNVVPPLAPVPAAAAKTPITKKWWFWVIIVVAVLLVIGAFSENDEKAGAGGKAAAEADVTAADIYKWIGDTDDNRAFDVSEKGEAFIEAHPDFFPGNDKNTGAMSDFVDYEVDYPQIAKSPSKYADVLINVSGSIVDCEEAETDYGTITFIHIYSNLTGYSYCVYYLGELENAFEGGNAWGYILPFGTITFENVGGYYTEAVVGAACYIGLY